jgi:hypothetical protein
VDKGDRGLAFIHGKIGELTWRQKLVGTDWVDIQPAPDMAGWEPVHGCWSVDAAGALIARGPEKYDPAAGNLMFVSAIFKPVSSHRFAMRGKFSALDERQSGNIGAFVAWFDELDSFGAFLHQDTGQVDLITGDWHGWRKGTPLGHDNQFEIDCWDGVVTVKINDKVLWPRIFRRARRRFITHLAEALTIAVCSFDTADLLH